MSNNIDIRPAAFVAVAVLVASAAFAIGGVLMFLLLTTR